MWQPGNSAISYRPHTEVEGTLRARTDLEGVDLLGSESEGLCCSLDGAPVGDIGRGAPTQVLPTILDPSQRPAQHSKVLTSYLKFIWAGKFQTLGSP